MNCSHKLLETIAKYLFAYCRNTVIFRDKPNASSCTRAQGHKQSVLWKREIRYITLCYRLLSISYNTKTQVFFLGPKRFKYYHEIQKDKTIKNHMNVSAVSTYMCMYDIITGSDAKAAKNYLKTEIQLQLQNSHLILFGVKL